MYLCNLYEVPKLIKLGIDSNYIVLELENTLTPHDIEGQALKSQCLVLVFVVYHMELNQNF